MEHPTPGGAWVGVALMAMLPAMWLVRFASERVAARWRRSHPVKRRPLPR